MARIKLATSKYLSAAALESVVPCRATITTVQEELVGIGAAAKNEWVVYLKAEVFGEKGLVLNATNRDALCALFGDETDDWTGKELTLTVADTIYAGKPVRGVRVAA